MYDAKMEYLRKNVFAYDDHKFTKTYYLWKNRKPVSIYPHTEPDQANAYYTRTEKGGEIFFFSFINKGSNERIFTCHSFDIVAHESGHAFLDKVCSEFNDNGRLITRSLHESFGDLTAIFLALEHKGIRDDLLRKTRGNLSKKSFLSALGEVLNANYGYNQDGIRDAIGDDDSFSNSNPRSFHELSQVFTRAIYAILAQTFEAMSQSDSSRSKSRTLF